MRIYSLAAVIVAASLTGCVGNLASVNHEFALTDGNSHLVDAYQRAIFVDTDRSDPAHHVVCAEPSPDALSVLSAALATSGKTPQVTVTANGSISQAAEAFGLRTQSIQLLRDSYYRLCEAYLSGAIDKFEYDIMLRRYGSDMVALIAIEQLTQAIRPQIQTVSASAAPSPPPDKNASSDTAPAPVTPAPGVHAENTVHEPRTARPEFVRYDEEPQVAAVFEKASFVVAAATPPPTGGTTPMFAKPAKPAKPTPKKPSPPAVPDSPSGPASNPPPSDNSATVAAVQAIALDILDKDYAGQMCFSYFKSVADMSPQARSHLDNFCTSTQTNYLTNQTAIVGGNTAAVQTQQQLADYFKVHCLGDASLQSSDDKKSCASLAQTLAGSSPSVSNAPIGPQTSIQSVSISGQPPAVLSVRRGIVFPALPGL